jgi:hypothetical protein
MILYYAAYVTFTYLGNFVSPFFYAFHLLDLVHRVETLKAVVRSVTYNGQQLIMTVVLVVVVVYLYAIVGFVMFRETMQVVSCCRLLSIFLQSCDPRACTRTTTAADPITCVKTCFTAIFSR